MTLEASSTFSANASAAALSEVKNTQRKINYITLFRRNSYHILEDQITSVIEGGYSFNYCTVHHDLFHNFALGGKMFSAKFLAEGVGREE